MSWSADLSKDYYDCVKRYIEKDCAAFFMQKQRRRRQPKCNIWESAWGRILQHPEVANPTSF